MWQPWSKNHSPRTMVFLRPEDLNSPASVAAKAMFKYVTLPPARTQPKKSDTRWSVSTGEEKIVQSDPRWSISTWEVEIVQSDPRWCTVPVHCTGEEEIIQSDSQWCTVPVQGRKKSYNLIPGDVSVPGRLNIAGCCPSLYITTVSV